MSILLCTWCQISEYFINVCPFTYIHFFLFSFQVTPELSSQALSTLLHIQKFYAYVVDYYEMEQLEVRAEFNRILREQDRFVKLVNKVLQSTIHL